MGIAVGAGSLLTLFPVHWKDLIVGVLFLGGAAYLLFVPESEEEEKGEREAAIEIAKTRWKEISTAFVVIFIGEFGDLTQIQAANFEAKLHQPLEVFLASSLALVAVSFLGAYSGRALQQRISLKHIRLFGGVVFAGLGLATLIALAVVGRMSRRDELLAYADTVKGFMPRDEGLALFEFALAHGERSAPRHVARDRRVVRQVGGLPGRRGRGDRTRCCTPSTTTTAARRTRRAGSTSTPTLVDPRDGRLNTLPLWQRTIADAGLEVDGHRARR